RDRACLCRQGIPRPRCPKPAPRLHLRPKTRGLRPHQTRAHAALRHRGGDRTYESRGPSQPLLSQRSRRRCRQRHPQRRRLQPSPRSCLAEDLFARPPTRATPDLHNSASPQTGFLTGDYVAFMIGGDLGAYLLGLVVEYEWGKHVSLIVFLALYFFSLWVAWMLAVWVTTPRGATSSAR